MYSLEWLKFEETKEKSINGYQIISPLMENISSGDGK